MWNNVVATQDEEEWFHEYVREALSCEAPRLPPETQKIGHVTATWFECRPGEAFICTRGGTGDDRVLAQNLLREQLRPHGLKQAGFTFEWHKDDPLRKVAEWDDVQAKALRLIQSGQVQVKRNGMDQVQGQVQGDHDTYDVWFALQDPAHPDVITQWECGCPWDQYAWQRTRQWKKYEGRVCSHVLALYWASKSLPKDEDAHPVNKAINPNQQSLFSMPGGSPVGAPGGQLAPGGGMPQGQEMSMMPFPMQQPATMPGMTAQPGMSPQPADVIPPFPMAPVDPAMMPNPASVPGLKQPSPTNPVQFPGGTFSHVEASWSGITAAEFVNGNMVSTRYEDWGEWVGRSSDHGAGERARIPANSPGEVLGQDPTTGMVNVLFMNQATGVNQHGKMEPWGITGWFMPSELVESKIRAPGPAIQRRR